MMFFPRKKNKWQAKSPALRLQAVEELEGANVSVLADLAVDDEDAAVRLAAAGKIEDLAQLDTVFEAAADDPVRAIVAAKRDQLRMQILLKEGSEEEHREHLAKIDDQEVLIEVAVGAFWQPVRLSALERIKEISSLEKIATRQCGKTVAERILSRIDEADILQRLSSAGGNKTIKRLANEKLAHLQTAERDKQSDSLIKELRGLVENARRLSDSVNWELARRRFDAIYDRWRSICHQEEHPLKSQLDEARATFKRRYEHHMARQQAIILQEEERRKLHGELGSILQRISDANPGLREEDPDPWAGLTARFEMLLQTLDEEQADYRDRLQEAVHSYEEKVEIWQWEKQKLGELSTQLQEIAESDEDLQIKGRRLNELSATVAATNWHFNAVNSLRQEIAALDNALAAKTTKERLAREQEKNVARQHASRILDELTSLYDHADMHKAVKRFSMLEESWQALSGDLPDAPELVAGYRKKRARFLVRQRDFQSLEDWRRWANGTVKARRMEEARSLDTIAELDQVFCSLKKLQARWKETGPAAGKANTLLWRQFHEQCQHQFERCKPYLEEQSELRQQQTSQIHSIAAEAEALVLSEDWGKTAGKFESLQKELAGLSLVSFKIRYEALARFRRSKNAFFERRRLALQDQEKIREHHLNQKIALCEQAERLSIDPTSATPADYIRLQKEWKKIGPAARKEEQKAWARFRQACDTYFDWLDQQRSENLRHKELLVAMAKETAESAESAEDFHSLSQKIMDLQQSWKQVGPVPKQESDRIWQEFRKYCDRFFAIRQTFLDTVDQEHLENQRKKEDIIEEVEQHAINLSDKEASERIKKLRKDFYALGPASGDIEHQLRQKMKTLCNHFFEGRTRFFTDMLDKRQELLKKKEALLFELERSVGIPADPKRKQQPQTLDLAAQLKLALQSNFALADRGSGTAVREEIARIQRQWKELAPLSYKLENALQQRFEDALAFFERVEKKKSAK